MSVNLKVSIVSSNEAFYDTPHEELARILIDAANKIRYGYTSESLRDYNGNTVGMMNLIIDDDES